MIRDNKRSPKILVIAVYTHPEYLPPALNAISELAADFEHIYIVHRNLAGFDWVYPSNVSLLKTGTTLPVRAAEAKPVIYKIREFLRFSFLLAKTIRKYGGETLLFYDYLPLLSYRIVRWYVPQQKILWYHNHDVAEAQYLRKYSLSWWGWKTENWIFPKLHLFTLPALERQVCFPMNDLTGQFFFVPNFPSVKIYSPYQSIKKTGDCIKLLYQGSISMQHGLEEIIPLLDNKIHGKEMYLVLKGFISQEYQQQLLALADQFDVKHRLIFKGPGGYREVIENAATCHIGIGIHKKEDVMNKTLGTASNKIYEYAALGLPALLYDNTHFRKHLGKYKWAFFTDCSAASIVDCLENIVNNYEMYSLQAKTDFKDSLNFEKFFLPVVDALKRIG